MISRVTYLVAFTFLSAEWETKQKRLRLVWPCHDVFHNNPILAEYAKVLVREITDMTCIDYSLDHVTPEGIKKLGEAVNQFIL
jgi:hypothetical protein